MAEGAFPLFDNRRYEPKLTLMRRNALIEIRFFTDVSNSFFSFVRYVIKIKFQKRIDVPNADIRVKASLM